MRKIIVPFVLLAVLLGCVPSVNPLYTEKDLAFDPALVGVWQGGKDKESWAFEKSGEKKYKLVQTDEDGRSAEFTAHLVKLKEHQFLDVVVKDPGDEEWKINMMARTSIIMRPGHFFFRVWQVEPTLKMALLDSDWIDKTLKENPKALRHERISFDPEKDCDSQLVLTAETKDLQKFILENLDKAFGEPTELPRKEKAVADSAKKEKD